MFVVGERGKSEYPRKKLHEKSIVREPTNSTVHSTELNPDHIGDGRSSLTITPTPLKKFKIHSEREVDQYLNKALNIVAEHSKDSIVFVPCFPVTERPFLPVIKEYIQ